MSAGEEVRREMSATNQPDEERRPGDGSTGLDRTRMSRRTVLRAGLGALTLAAAPSVLAACGGGEDGGGGTGTSGGSDPLAAYKQNGARLGVAEVLPSASVDGGQAVGIF